jgi:hypothetical protein
MGSKAGARRLKAQFSGALKLYLPNGSWLPHDRSPMAEALHKGIPICDRELILERPDESRIVVLINVSPLQDEAGKTVAVVSFFRDITAQKHLEAELREYEQELKHAAEVQNRLAAIVPYGSPLPRHNPGDTNDELARLRREMDQLRREMGG